MKWFGKAGLMAIVLVGLLAGCQNKKNPLSLELLGRKSLGEEKVVRIQKMDAIEVNTFDANTAFSSEVFVGKAGGYTAATLLKFGAFSNLPDTASIDRVVLRLYSRAVINPQDQTNLTVNIYTAKMAWNPTEVEADADLNAYRGDLKASGTVTDRTAAYDSLAIPPELVKGWKDSTIENNGLLLDADAEALIKSYDSY
jgi:hypothetical protein